MLPVNYPSTLKLHLIIESSLFFPSEKLETLNLSFTSTTTHSYEVTFFITILSLNILVVFQFDISIEGASFLLRVNSSF